MNGIELIIPGKPRGKGRPRFGNGTAYTDKETAEYERLVRLTALQTGIKPLSGAVHMDITAYYPIPRSGSKASRLKRERGEEYPLVKPDIDNITKIIMDALNGYAYADDKQVISVTAIKKYGREPKVVVKVIYKEEKDEKRNAEY